MNKDPLFILIFIGILIFSLFIFVGFILNFEDKESLGEKCGQILDMKKVYNNLSSDLKDFLFLNCGMYY